MDQTEQNRQIRISKEAQEEIQRAISQVREVILFELTKSEEIEDLQRHAQRFNLLIAIKKEIQKKLEGEIFRDE